MAQSIRSLDSVHHQNSQIESNALTIKEIEVLVMEQYNTIGYTLLNRNVPSK
jgi:hypothetical protein